ncbi:hypothetical protein CC78DRAFT_500327 [Lojkania enalia]|uniref:NAD(P)-binding domain-containing protein n=1 Tax=Lojkania enalia TaxID=147567 RepID=A0A9P4K4E0_9PLEO|nr:hypothetical protein CC78DRAFT_500327 [Didymosphaeria enalia]
MSSSKSTIAFFGATGGCTGSSLAHALREGHSCTALVRTPEKLRDILTSQYSIPTSTIAAQLTIHVGDIKDPNVVSKAIVSPNQSSHLVDIIYSGIGGTPVLGNSIREPFKITDPTICEVGMKCIFTALSNLQATGISATCDGRNPLLICISTTGVSAKHRDVPLPIYPLYHWALAAPHKDKKAMESVVINDKNEHIRDFVIVRPTLLSDSEPRGISKVRAGWEWGAKEDQEPGPRMGYYVGRKDVGEWIYRRVIAEGGWDGRCVSLTY